MSSSYRLASLCYSVADQNAATTKSIGIYNFSVQLLKALAGHSGVERLTALVNPTLARDLQLPGSVATSCHTAPLDRMFGRILWDQWRVYSAARSSQSQWLFLPKGFASFVRRPPVQLAAYVHDVMGEYYRERYPGYYSGMEQRYFTRSLRATLRRAQVVFTNTEFSRGEILRLSRRWRLPDPHVVTAGYGFTPGSNSREPKCDSVLLFASQMPHKRTDLAIRFLEAWMARTEFTGRIDCIGIFSDAWPRPKGRAWNWVGRVPPAEGRAMIRKARVVVYTSEYEGFGMPPVEAVLENTCPVFSDIAPIREVMGEAGVAFSNENVDSFATAMERGLKTSAEQIERWKQDLLARHNWGRVADTVLGELAGMRRPGAIL